jgi:hypothetical protein
MHVDLMLELLRICLQEHLRWRQDLDRPHYVRCGLDLRVLKPVL